MLSQSAAGTGSLLKWLSLKTRQSPAAIAFSPDCQYLLEGTGGIWDVQAGRRVGILPFKWWASRANNRQFALSGLERYFVGSGEVALWAVKDLLRNVNYGSQMPERHLATPVPDIYPGHPVAFSPDSHRIGTVDGSRLHLWDLGTGALVKEFDTGDDYLRSLSFSADGKHVIVDAGIGGNDRHLIKLGIPDLQPEDTYSYTEVNGDTLCNYSFDGRRVLLAKLDKVVVLDPLGLTEIRRYSPNANGGIRFANVFPNSERLFVGLDDPTDGGGSGERVYTILDADSEETIGLVPAYALTWAWDPVARPNLILAQSGRSGAGVTAFSLTGEIIKKFNEVAFGRGAVLSSDGNYLAGVSDLNFVTLWHFETGRLLGIFEGNTKPSTSRQVQISNDNRWLLAADTEGVSVWNVAELTTGLRVTSDELGRQIHWDHGILQFALEPSGPWTDLPAASPFILSPIGEKGFFHVKVE